MNWLLQFHQRVKLKEVFSHLLSSIRAGAVKSNTTSILGMLIGFLQKAPYLAVTFLDLGSWADLPDSIRSVLESRSLEILEAFCLVANEMQVFVVEPFRTFLSQVRHLPLSVFGSLVKQICLVVRQPETALDLLMGVLELESSRLLVERPILVKYFVADLIGVGLEHIDEAKDSRATREDQLQLKFGDSPGVVNSRLRIDSHSKMRFAANDHVHLTAASLPSNSLETRPYTMDALIQRSEPGNFAFQCFHPLPPYMEDCAWKVKNCGSFVTSQAMFEALERFVPAPEVFCPIHNRLMGFAPYDDPLGSETERLRGEEAGSHPEPPESSLSPNGDANISSFGLLDDLQQLTAHLPNTMHEHGDTMAHHGRVLTTQRSDLYDSQNEALQAALNSSLTCLWGPPGTGKTHTVAVILEKLLKNPDRRILVTAPTHNAVDNVMRKFLYNMQQRKTWTGEAVRVSTDVSQTFIRHTIYPHRDVIRYRRCKLYANKSLIARPGPQSS